MNRVIVFFASILVLVSCKTVDFTTATSKKIQTIDTLSDNSIVYGLPKSTFVFGVKQVKEKYFPGPFAEYASLLLGIEGVEREINERYYVDNISISQYRELDSEMMFVINPGDERIEYLKLSKQGLIFFPENINVNDVFNNSNGESIDKHLFTNTTLKPNYNIKNTSLSRVSGQNDYSGVPVMRKQLVQKSKIDKAKEAAEVILNIRERRLLLLLGEEELFPVGEAMQSIIDELARIEKEYLSLFIGKRLKAEQIYYFEYTPDKQDIELPYVLFRFADNKGIVDENNFEGRPFVVDIEGLSTQIEDSVVVSNGLLSNSHRIYYRIPEVVTIKIVDKSNILARKRVLIEQFGKISSAPAKNIKF